MEKKYKVRVNDSLEFEFSEEELNSLDDREITAGNFHILENNRSVKGEIINSEFLKRAYRVKINNSGYDVKIFNELDQLIEKMGLSLSAGKVQNDLKAPMPGLILEVNVKEGDEVNEGDYLLVLEAMKMENTLTAPRDGVVKSVSVEKGQTVDKNQLLIEME
ncbi:acetyl-CoA carboxylase biotin carboxyl carrier protein subunit [Antarcticibacterium sp. 1MA-6-2]|uniref:acetyl-CoA carboxylase biotin carboxyl carrier protein subunit n=1 Tax=Antarcticibacterium sp. 1MA-6-2 TaxID=2908210 RepID=UPI001F352064|nr:acetyl-CoA carboxylase biotin carboxyl carrier protein subunit [Antarcticibacterium sp. 1MA-6-2]UJH92036.1 acetyl-CoA carboxylase biotin carboxyl carrier protein subunit [Antarcticibacterium sp. 1MA-6-2]